MAIKPTIYKVLLQLADTDRHFYQDYNLTLAQHPSETLERLCVRLYAFCRHASERLEFSKGLGADDEPELWQKSDAGEIELWLEVGQPEPERLKKASRKCQQLCLYTFSKSSDTWWQLNQAKILADNCRVEQLAWADMQAMASLIKRQTELSVTLSDGLAYIAVGDQNLTIAAKVLKE